jgi:anion-transporting  ArsA/GET3 family ATPase
MDYKSMVRLKMVLLLKQDFQLPALERMLTGKSLSFDDKPLPMETFLQVVSEQNMKFEMILRHMQHLDEKMSLQVPLLEDRSKIEKVLMEQIQAQSEIQEQLLKKIEDMSREQASTLVTLTELAKRGNPELEDEVKEMIARQRE